MDALIAAVAALDYASSLRLVEEALTRGESGVEIVHATQAGLRLVGERYERQDVFLSGLIMAGEIFRGVMELAQPAWEEELEGGASGLVLLGTAAGDIHDVGKNLASLTFKTFGFAVNDLGVDVPPERFLETARQIKPDIMGLSGLVTTAFNSMRETVALIRAHEEELEEMPIIVIGGATIDGHVARYVGADHWTNDAMEGVRICQRLLESRRETR
ncbi:MAG: hypothetical protein A2133_07820 [Actinobacteria bacterium RBG_16_64_13]|nr:MAG: hypothetical protein A2133_07820 [Actinobacteria bacterium RBG_16_64_13]